MSTKLKIAAAVAAAVLLSACSSPKHEPMPLVKFTPSMEVTEVWSKGLSSALESVAADFARESEHTNVMLRFNENNEIITEEKYRAILVGLHDRIMESSVERYNVGRLPYPVRDGILTVEIGPFCAMIFEEKVLDF